MSLTQSNGICPALLIGANEAANNALFNIIESYGAIQSLYDPTNRSTVIQVDSGNGHRKQVRVMRKQRVSLSDISSTNDPCSTPSEKPILEDIVDVNLVSSHTIGVSEVTIRRMCSAYSELVSISGGMLNENTLMGISQTTQGQKPLSLIRAIYEEIATDLNQVVAKMNQDIITSMMTKIGAYVGGDTTKNFAVIKTADGSPVLKGFNEMRQEAKKSGFSGMPIVIAGGNFDLANSALGVGCCNDGGTDFGQMAKNFGYKFYQDFSIDGPNGLDTQNGFIFFMPGAMQHITYNENKGRFGKIGNMERGVLPLPSLNNQVYADIYVRPSECDNMYYITITVNHDLYALPTDLFSAGDTLAGVNGIFAAVATAI